MKTYTAGQIACGRDFYGYFSGDVGKRQRRKTTGWTAAKRIKTACGTTAIPGWTPLRPGKVIPGVWHGANRHAADRDEIVPFVTIEEKVEIGAEPKGIRYV
jgi:hypothetical protein